MKMGSVPIFLKMGSVPIFPIFLAACALMLAACETLKGEAHVLRDVTGVASEQQEFYGIVDGVARRHRMTPLSCSTGKTGVSCWKYRGGGVFLEARIDMPGTQYEVAVYEWNVRTRAPKALEIEAEALAELRRRFGGRLGSRPLTDQDGRQP